MQNELALRFKIIIYVKHKHMQFHISSSTDDSVFTYLAFEGTLQTTHATNNETQPYQTETFGSHKIPQNNAELQTGSSRDLPRGWAFKKMAMQSLGSDPKNLETEYTWLVVEGTITHLQLFLRIQGQLTTSRSVWTSLAMIEVTLPLLACQVSKVESLLLRQLNRTFTEGRPMQSIRNHPKILSKWNQQHTSQIWPWQRQTKSSEVEALSRRKPGGFCLQIGQKESTYPQGNNSR